jgi:hypothetical protein
MEYDFGTAGNTVLACRFILTQPLSQESQVVIPVKPMGVYDDVVSETDALPRRAVESEFPSNRYVRRAQTRKCLFHSVTFIDASFSMCARGNLRRTHKTYAYDNCVCYKMLFGGCCEQWGDYDRAVAPHASCITVRPESLNVMTTGRLGTVACS